MELAAASGPGRLVDFGHRWIGSHPTTIAAFGNESEMGTFHREWHAYVLVDENHSVFFAHCSCPQETAQSNARVCAAFFANVRFAGEAP